MNILQVVTEHSPNGVNGGPYSVAFNLSRELVTQGHTVTLISQARYQGYREFEVGGVREMIFPAKLLSSAYYPSSLYPNRRIRSIINVVHNADVVHIHFARDIFPIFVAILCIFKRKKFVLQCHGMITKSRRVDVRLADFIVVKSILRNASKVLVLTVNERRRLPIKDIDFYLLPNGISAVHEKLIQPKKEIDFVFIGRLTEIKRPVLFIDLVEEFQNEFLSNSRAVIYGPDAGELPKILSRLSQVPNNLITYGGALMHDFVTEKLSQSKLLLVTSRHENFPMIVVEAMSVGTPVLLFDQFDISALVATEFPEMIISGNVEVKQILNQMRFILSESEKKEYRIRIQEFAKKEFDLAVICECLIKFVYLESS